jgi:hypothetical protein
MSEEKSRISAGHCTESDEGLLLRDVREELRMIAAIVAARRSRQAAWPAVESLRTLHDPEATQVLDALIRETARAVREDLMTLRRLLDLEAELATETNAVH